MQAIIHHQHPKYQLKNQTLLTKILETALEATVPKDDPYYSYGLNFCLVDSEQITELNESYVNHEGATDVITFDYRDDLEIEEEPDEDEVIGEIYICLDIAKEYSARFENDFQKEAVLYMVHGILHLFGEDDITEEQRQSMRKAERRVMNILEEKFEINGIFE